MFRGLILIWAFMLMSGVPAAWADVLPAERVMPAPSFLLVQPNGEPLSDRPPKGVNRVWVFGFTRCGYACPMMLFNLSKLTNELSASDRDQLEVVFVTVDPEHDTLAVIDQYVDKFSTSFKAARPVVTDIAPWMAKIGLSLERDDEANVGERFEHTSRMVLQDSNGYMRAFWPVHAPKADMEADLAVLAKERSSVLSRLREMF